MTSPLRPIWSEGLLLTPQHLQALDKHHESLLESRVSALAPAGWGVSAFEIDQAALGSGRVRLTRFEGILPDGLPLSFDEGEAPNAKPVAAWFPPSAKSLSVYVGVARERDGVASFAEDAVEARARYGKFRRSQDDATNPGSVQDLLLGRAVPVLLLEGESQVDFVTIKIAELVRSPSGGLAESPRFVPPVLRLGASRVLVEALRGVSAGLFVKQRSLAAARHQPGAPASEQSTADLGRGIQLLAVSVGTAELGQLADDLDAPPREAFAALLRLAGALSALSTFDLAALPRFSHVEPGPAFGRLIETVEALLAEIRVVDEFTSISLETKAGLSSGSLAGSGLAEEPRPRVFLLVKSDLPRAELNEKILKFCKVASQSKILGLMNSNLPGIPLVAVDPPPQLPERPGAAYFQIQTGTQQGGFHPEWKLTQEKRAIAIYLPPQCGPKTTVEILSIGSPGQG